MLSRLDGATRISVIIGTPVVQVRSPEGITRALQARGLNALLVPLEVAADDVPALLTALRRVPNLDGVTVTVPHKQAALACCAWPSERARFLGAVNVMHRLVDGSFEGDHVDGESMVAALGNIGFDPAGRQAFLLGAGGAGSAIALSMMEAGVERLEIADQDSGRAEGLAVRLAGRFPGRTVRAVALDAAQLEGIDLLVNATPAGMKTGDAPPVDVGQLAGHAVVADVVTPPAESALIVAARGRGLRAVNGRDMFEAGIGLITDFMVHGASGRG